MSALRLSGRYSVKEVLILVAYEECNVDGVDAMQPASPRYGSTHAHTHTHTHTHTYYPPSDHTTRVYGPC